MTHIFDQIAAERKRQDEKWGEQNHTMLGDFFDAEAILEKCKLYKAVNDSGEDPCWFPILLEEVYEAFAETDPVRQREEMVQVAAVAVQIIEALDRQIDGGKR